MGSFNARSFKNALYANKLYAVINTPLFRDCQEYTFLRYSQQIQQVLRGYPAHRTCILPQLHRYCR